MSLSPATLSCSSWGILRHFQARWDMQSLGWLLSLPWGLLQRKVAGGHPNQMPEQPQMAPLGSTPSSLWISELLHLSYISFWKSWPLFHFLEPWQQQLQEKKCMVVAVSQVKRGLSTNHKGGLIQALSVHAAIYSDIYCICLQWWGSSISTWTSSKFSSQILDEVVQFIVHNSKFWTKFTNELVHSYLYSICCFHLLFFRTISTAHIEPQTAIILSVFNVPFQVCCWRWCTELLLETRQAKFTQKCQIFPTWIITDLFIKLFEVIIRRCCINGGGRVWGSAAAFISFCLHA